MRFNKIYIELSDICGLDCSFCPSIKGKRGIMPLDFFSHATLQCSRFTNLIALHILGDPLRIKNLKEYLLIARQHKLRVEITTSGAYLDEFDFLLYPPIKQVNISLDALMDIESKSFRDMAFKKIFEFCRYRDSSNSDIFVNLRIQNRLNPKSEELKNILRNEFNLLALEANTRIGKKTIIVLREPFLWNINNNAKEDENIDNKGFCYGLISHFGILSNGDVVPCCIDANGDIVLGNLKYQSLSSILFGEKSQNIRNGFKNGLIVEKSCLKCNYRERFNDNRITKCYNPPILH